MVNLQLFFSKSYKYGLQDIEKKSDKTMKLKALLAKRELSN